MNTLNIVGRWTRDNELRYSAGGVAILKNSIAVNRPFSKTKEVDFFDVTAFGKIAENTANYTGKGRLVGITGRLQQDRWETDAGDKRSKVGVIANEIEFLDYADQASNQQTNQQINNDVDMNAVINEFQEVGTDDDIPF